MINKAIFRQYDIRGIVNKELHEKNTKLIGYYLGLAIQEKTKVKNPYIVVGYDIRKHSYMFFESLISGLNLSGCNILNIGLVATGVNYFASYQKFEIDNKNIIPQASIMITGSHNAKQYNGFKITIENQPYFADDLIKLYEAIKTNEKIDIPNNHKFIEVDAKTLYINYMVDQFKELANLKNKFVIDCGNGMADIVITEIFDRLKLNYKALYKEPNGDFPNHHPDPSNEKNLSDLKSYLKDDCHYGFAYDGDADRIAVLTQNHNIKGDTLALLFSKTMKNPVIIGEVTYSQNIFDEINTHGTTVMDKTGYSNLRLKLQELNADLAAEVSGHIFFNDRYYGFDDAIYATFRVLELIKSGMQIDEEIEKLPKLYTSSNIEIEIQEDKKFLLMKRIEESLKRLNRDFPVIKDICRVDGLRINFEYGWALVRASNTNPILVSKYEANTYATAMTYKNSLEKLIQKEIDELNSTTS